MIVMKPVSVIQRSWNEMLNEDKAMQDLTHYYKHIFTLKNGEQIKICTKLPYDEVVKEIFNTSKRIQITGFVISPLLIEKKIEIRKADISAREEIKDPCIAQVVPWPEEVDVINEHPEGCNCQECYYKRSNLGDCYTNRTGAPYKTIAEMKAAALEKYKTNNNTLENFLLEGTQVKVITPCRDHYFFYGETGKVFKFWSEPSPRIEVEFDLPRKFQDGTIQKSFIFEPKDLITIFDFERLEDKPVEDMVLKELIES